MGLENWTSNTSTTWNLGSPPAGLGELNYREMNGTRKMNFGRDNATGERIFIIDWNRLTDFLDDVLGWSYYDGAGAIKRILPDQHPFVSTMWAMSASVEPHGFPYKDSDDFITPYFAKVTVGYEPVDFAVLTDGEVLFEIERYVSRTNTYHPEFLQTTGGVKFATTGRPLGEQPGFTTYTTQLVMIWHQVPSVVGDEFNCPNAQLFAEMQGTINSDEFDGYRVGTVLFEGFEPKMEKPKRGEETYFWEITLNFRVKDNGDAHDGQPAGWNYVFDTTKNRWDKIVSITGGNVNYKSADFSLLFEVV